MSATISKKEFQANSQNSFNFGSAVADLNVVRTIENKIIQIFEEDKKLVNPVFLFVNEGFTLKLAYFLAGFIKRPVSIGIAGETASGKSTFTMDVLETISEFEKKHNMEQVVTRVNTDDYYYDRSKEVIAAGGFAQFAKNYDFDIPDAFELDLLKTHVEQLVLGQEVWLPKYDMSGTAIRHNNYLLAKPNKIIISEGLFNLSDQINNVFDFCIYVEVDHEAQKERFYKRSEQRGLGDAAKQIYDNAVEKAEIYVKPTSKNADITVNGMADRKEYKRVINKLLDIIIFE